MDKEKDSIFHYFPEQKQYWESFEVRKPRKFLVGLAIKEFVLTDGRFRFTVFSKQRPYGRVTAEWNVAKKRYFKNHPITTIFK